jgi:hypothetical protein
MWRCGNDAERSVRVVRSTSLTLALRIRYHPPLVAAPERAAANDFGRSIREVRLGGPASSRTPLACAASQPPGQSGAPRDYRCVGRDPGPPCRPGARNGSEYCHERTHRSRAVLGRSERDAHQLSHRHAGKGVDGRRSARRHHQRSQRRFHAGDGPQRHRLGVGEVGEPPASRNKRPTTPRSGTR